MSFKTDYKVKKQLTVSFTWTTFCRTSRNDVSDMNSSRTKNLYWSLVIGDIKNTRSRLNWTQTTPRYHAEHSQHDSLVPRWTLSTWQLGTMMHSLTYSDRIMAWLVLLLGAYCKYKWQETDERDMMKHAWSEHKHVQCGSKVSQRSVKLATSNERNRDFMSLTIKPRRQSVSNSTL